MHVPHERPQVHTREEDEILRKLLQFNEREFEYAAAEILALLDRNFRELQLTPHRRDGGRDVIGIYSIRGAGTELDLAFHAEAKRWKSSSSVGVRPVARLISRIKHREFGVFITTSYFNRQVQEEIIADQHPVKFLSGGDIARLLISRHIAGVGRELQFAQWLDSIRKRALGG